MFEVPSSIQWAMLCDYVISLAQMRFCVYNLVMEGGFLFIRAKSCDLESTKLILIINSEGELL